MEAGEAAQALLAVCLRQHMPEPKAGPGKVQWLAGRRVLKTHRHSGGVRNGDRGLRELGCTNCHCVL